LQKKVYALYLNICYSK